jgi:hypothetical protein
MGDLARALWNRSEANWDSNEVLAQILERGTMEDWREVYRRAEADPQLRQRLTRLVLEVPVPLPRFWLAALANLDPDVDVGAEVPDYYTATSVV